MIQRQRCVLEMQTNIPPVAQQQKYNAYMFQPTTPLQENVLSQSLCE